MIWQIYLEDRDEYLYIDIYKCVTMRNVSERVKMQNLGSDTVVEHMSNMYKSLGLIPAWQLSTLSSVISTVTRVNLSRTMTIHTYVKHIFKKKGRLQFAVQTKDKAIQDRF